MTKKFSSHIISIIAVCFAVVFCFLCACSPVTDTNDSKQEEESAIKEEESIIKSVSAIGFVDTDGAKLSGVAVEYDEDLAGATLTTDMYQLRVYTPNSFIYKGNGNVGDILKIYVNDQPNISSSGGSGNGKYVVMELFTDYLSSSEATYATTMTVRLTQKKEITCGSGTVIKTDGKTVSNVVANKPTNLVMDDIAGFKWYTNNAGLYGADGPAFHQANCFNQQDGLYYDEDLSYALYLPENYSENGNYAMVTLQNPAATEGTHPLESVLTTRSPALYASEWAQNLVKQEHGVDGLIVVVPVITERVNDNGGTPAQYEAVVHLWDYIIEKYHVDTNYIYGSGQSVGGMILLETNRLRDNFFAGLLLYEDQWAQNYYPETIFARNMTGTPKIAETAPMHYSRTDEYLTWDYSLDTNGEKVYEDHDPYNMYYLISDDNIMIMNRTNNNLSVDAWTELKYLYSDLCGYELEKLVLNANDDVTKQNTSLKNYVSRKNTLNINWVSFENGSNGYSCRKLDSSYEWLLSQSRQSEISREKLDLNKPFELAETQDTSSDRELHFTQTDGSSIYFMTGKAGAGTGFYNSCWLNTASIADAVPGWLPENLNWQTGVEGANILGVTKISDTAVAIEYDKDMTNVVIHLKGDDIIGTDGTVRKDIKYEVSPYEFYDNDGNYIECTIKNVYVNSTKNMRTGAAKCSGSGNFIIVEFEKAVTKNVVGVVQRTTVITDKYLASASHIVRRYDN